MKLSDSVAYALLKNNGIEVAEFGYAKTLDQAEVIAENLALPLVLKIDSPDIIHKFSSGCVKFVHTREEFKEKFSDLMLTARKITKNINGIIIQELVNGLETIVGAKYDEQFGHVLMFGTGGVHAEAIRDVSFRLIPIKEKDAYDMINSTKISCVIPNKQSIAYVLLKVSGLVQKNPDIIEFDINPLFATQDRAIAVDVRVFIQKPLN